MKVYKAVVGTCNSVGISYTGAVASMVIEVVDTYNSVGISYSPVEYLPTLLSRRHLQFCRDIVQKKRTQGGLKCRRHLQFCRDIVHEIIEDILTEEVVDTYNSVGISYL